MLAATCIATSLEKRRPLPGDALVPEPIFVSTHAITIDASPDMVWPWIAQMGAGRAGWHSWDAIDNGVGGLILAHASLGLLWPFAAMHQRDVLAAGGATLSDTMHVVLGGITVVLMFLTIGFGATAFGRRFRLYSIASIVVLLAFGGLTFLEAPRLQANLPTPLIGLWERINITVFLLWVVVLAIELGRTGTAQGKIAVGGAS